MDSYILRRRLCNVLSRIVIVFESFTLRGFPLEEASEHISLFFLLSRDIYEGLSIFSCVLCFFSTFYVISLKFLG
jgi:hypothetical protein